MIERMRNAVVADIKRQGDDDRGPWVGGMLSVFSGHTGIEVDGDLDPMSIAHAVLAAMREPTLDMKIAGDRIAWEDMIDAALAEAGNA